MRTAKLVASCLILSSGIACSSSNPSPPSQPQPVASRSASPAATLGIPPGHFPPPGMCRVWTPGKPPGRQAASRTCHGIERAAPAGTWILYRPKEDKKVIHVRVLDGRRPGVVVGLRVYDVKKGVLVRKD